MIVVNTDYITGKNIETLGMVFASAVQTKNAFYDIGAGLKNIIGGKLNSYSKMIDEAASMAVNSLIEKAMGMGADAVVNVRFSSSSVMAGAAEIIASGTAVKFV